MNNRTPTTEALLDLADAWAAGTSMAALEVIMSGKAPDVDMLGTTFRSMFMLGANLALAIAAIDPEAAMSIRASIVEQMGAVSERLDIGATGNEMSNVVNRYAAQIIDTHRKETR